MRTPVVAGTVSPCECLVAMRSRVHGRAITRLVSWEPPSDDRNTVGGALPQHRTPAHHLTGHALGNTVLRDTGARANRPLGCATVRRGGPSFEPRRVPDRSVRGHRGRAVPAHVRGG